MSCSVRSTRGTSTTVPRVPVRLRRSGTATTAHRNVGAGSSSSDVVPLLQVVNVLRPVPGNAQLRPAGRTDKWRRQFRESTRPAQSPPLQPSPRSDGEHHRRACPPLAQHARTHVNSLGGIVTDAAETPRALAATAAARDSFSRCAASRPSTNSDTTAGGRRSTRRRISESLVTMVRRHSSSTPPLLAPPPPPDMAGQAGWAAICP